jgi:hypothetical protein
MCSRDQEMSGIGVIDLRAKKQARGRTSNRGHGLLVISGKGDLPLGWMIQRYGYRVAS